MNTKRFLRYLVWGFYFAYTPFLFYGLIGWFLKSPSGHSMYLDQIFLIPQEDMNAMAVVFYGLYLLNLVVLDDLGYEHPRVALLIFVSVIGIASINTYTDPSWLNILLNISVGLLFVSWVGQLRYRGLSINKMMESLSEV